MSQVDVADEPAARSAAGRGTGTVQTRVGNRVRELREDRLMTREELAERAGVSLRTVWSVESGKPCRLPTKRRILEALGLARTDHREVFPHG
jgi:transcriptional regulator with XRE-family HTH domain